ncbi:MAG: HlyC/CorC family transporter [Deltaproteobacteria bacterium]|nr:HlyC/CorC family transporter [Deltaproteobacteria bacterium]
MTALALVGAVFCVLANGFFVAAEFALVKVRRTHLEALARKGDAGARRAFEITGKLDEYLSATQFGITLASLALGWIGEPAFAGIVEVPLRWFGMAQPEVVHGIAVAVAFATITVLHIVIGELAPKSMAIRDAEKVSRAVGLPMKVFFVATYPLMWLLNSLSNLTLRVFGLPPTDHAEGALSAEEIGLVVGRAKLDDRKRELLERTLRSTDRPVRAVMVPRVDAVFLSTEDSTEEGLRQARRAGFSRMPLIEGRDPDKVVGYVYLKDLLMAEKPPAGGLVALKRDVLFVPETRTVGEVLEDFQSKHVPMAIVVDEYGGTAGLVTMEDIVEEIVGDLQDEHDLEPPSISEQPDGSLLADGLVPVGDLVAVAGQNLPEDASETLGGFMVGELRRLARIGDTVRVGDFDASVVDVRRRRVTKVRLVRRVSSGRPPSSEGDGGTRSSSPPENHSSERRSRIPPA